MKKFISALSVALVLATVLSGFTGCAKKSDQSTSSAASQDSNKPVTLTMMWWGTQARHESTQKVIDAYTKLHPNVKFTASPLGWQGYSDKLSVEAAGGSLPDIFQNDYSFLDKLAKNNAMADMNPYVKNKSLDLSGVDPTLKSTGVMNNKLIAIVISIGAPSVIYNPDVFSKAGLSAPTDNWTWDDFVNDSMTIKSKLNVYGTALYSPQDDTRLLNIYLRQYGEHVFSTDGKKLGYTDKHFVELLNMMKKLQDAGAMPNPDQEAQIETKSKDQWPIVTGGMGLMLDNFNYPVMAAKSNPNLQEVEYPCSVKGAKPNFTKPGMFFSVANTSKNKQAAADFINYFINDQSANTALNAERGVPVSSKIRSFMLPSLSAQNKVMFEYVDRVQKNSSKIDNPEPTGTAEIVTDLNNEEAAVLYGKKSSTQAAADFRKEATAVLANSAS